MFYTGICQFSTSQQENHTGFAPPGPRLWRGAGALSLAPRLPTLLRNVRDKLRKPCGLASLAAEPPTVSPCSPQRPSVASGRRRTRCAVSPSMFTVADNHKPGYSNQGRMFHCGRAIYRALLIIAPGMGAVMRRGAGRIFCSGGGGSQRKRPRRRLYKNRPCPSRI